MAVKNSRSGVDSPERLRLGCAISFLRNRASPKSSLSAWAQGACPSNCGCGSAEIQRIDPPAFPEIDRVHLSEDREVIAVRVSPGVSLPYQYRGASYLRVGNTTQTMSTEEYNRILFERMHTERRWENQPANGWTVEDLDVAEIRNTIAEAVRIGRLSEPGSREPEDLLRGLGLLQSGVLFRSAAVLFGYAERLESEMPQCLLRVARFRGLDRSEFLDNRQFNGNAFALLANAEHFLRETLAIASHFESGRMARIDEPLYPPLATRGRRSPTRYAIATMRWAAALSGLRCTAIA